MRGFPVRRYGGPHEFTPSVTDTSSHTDQRERRHGLSGDINACHCHLQTPVTLTERRRRKENEQQPHISIQVKQRGGKKETNAAVMTYFWKFASPWCPQQKPHRIGFWITAENKLLNQLKFMIHTRVVYHVNLHK